MWGGTIQAHFSLYPQPLFGDSPESLCECVLCETDECYVSNILIIDSGDYVCVRREKNLPRNFVENRISCVEMVYLPLSSDKWNMSRQTEKVAFHYQAVLSRGSDFTVHFMIQWRPVELYKDSR